MAWGTHRKGRLLSVALPHNIVSELIRRKSQRGLSMTYQIVEALTSQFNGGQGAPPAVVQRGVVPLAPSWGPRVTSQFNDGQGAPPSTVVTQPLVPSRYASMRSQPIPDRSSNPFKNT